MESLQYSKLLAALDARIEEAKRIAEEKARREALEQHVKLVVHQMTNIAARKAELEKLGVPAPMDLADVLRRLEAERASFEKQLRGEPEQPKQTRLCDADRQAMEALYAEVMDLPIDQLEHEEKWAQFEVWGVRWRIVAERAGNDVANADGFLKMCYARIRERMDASPPVGWFISALDRDRSADWPTFLKTAEERLGGLIDTRRQREEAERAAEEAIQALVQQIRLFEKAADDGNERLLRHHARNAAKFAHLREEVAEILSPMRPRLSDEFGFLWANGKHDEGDEPAARKLTNQEVLARLCRRMRSKTLIGACHGPWDKIYKGFPDHDQGRAKEALEMLAKAGVLRKKSTVIGVRVSIEPKMMPAVEAAIEGRPTGIAWVDEWCGEATAQTPRR